MPKLKDGDTVLLVLKDTDHFMFLTGEEEENLEIYAPEILLLTPKRIKFYRFFKFLVKRFNPRRWWFEFGYTE